MSEQSNHPMSPAAPEPATQEQKRERWRQLYHSNPEAARMRSRRSYDKHREQLLEKRKNKRDAQRLLEGRQKNQRRTPLLPRMADEAHESSSSSPENGESPLDMVE